jgi:histidine ammonia-lyase
MRPVRLDGRSLTQRTLVEVAHGAPVELDAEALKAVARAADFLATQVAREEPIYGVSTGFGAQADKCSARVMRAAATARCIANCRTT